MTPARQRLCLAYGALSVVSLIACWKQNFAYFGGEAGMVESNVRFWSDALVNPAARSVTVDLFLFATAVAIWMLLEARRLAIRGVWIYVFAGILVGISVTAPLFLIARERRLHARGEAGHLGVTAVDLVVLALFIAAPAAITAWTLAQ